MMEQGGIESIVETYSTVYDKDKQKWTVRSGQCSLIWSVHDTDLRQVLGLAGPVKSELVTCEKGWVNSDWFWSAPKQGCERGETVTPCSRHVK